MERPAPAEGDGDASSSTSFRSVAGRRVPAWLALLLVLAVAVPLGVLLVAERMSDVELGPAVSGAEGIDVELRLCKDVVDANGIDARKAELDLQSTLEDEGADGVDVRVRRRDCPPARR